ncbi:MAG: ribonuclease P protein component [Endomicrobiales bacterium]|nr:ribonuclease P protein component [Endomicrobiales bacterium]
MTAEKTKKIYTFKHIERLHDQKDFKRILAKGRKLVHPAIFVFVYKRNDNSELRRLGLITSRKLGTAVKRNLLKRRLREIFRLNKYKIIPGVDVIFIPRRDAIELNYNQLESIVFALWQRAKIAI